MPSAFASTAKAILVLNRAPKRSRKSYCRSKSGGHEIYRRNQRRSLTNLISFLQIKSGYLFASLAAFALFHSTASAFEECMATLKDPHGSVEVSCDGDTK